MKGIDDIVREFRKIKPDYAFDADIMCEDEPRTRRLKYIINNRLTIADRTIIILYAELQSFRKLGECLGVSHTTMRTEVNRIKEIIKREYGRTGNDSNDSGVHH